MFDVAIPSGYSGIGVETVKALLSVDATVVVAGRNPQALEKFVSEQQAAIGDGKGVVDGIELDLGDLSSVKAFVEAFRAKYDRLDVLINNAGVMNTPQGSVTAQGLEKQFGVNVVGTFLISKLLLPLIKANNGRIIFLSSVGHSIHGAQRLDLAYYRSFDPKTSPYNGWTQYQQSKLGDLLLAKEFVRRFEIEAASVHPGFINTNLARDSTIWSFVSFAFKNFGKIESAKAPEQGAATTVLTALSPDLDNGAYYADCAVKKPHNNATHEQDCIDLGDYCEEVTADFQ